jgi:ammonium transporter, Amt family
MDDSLLDALWVLGCAALVFGMQAGFLCLESGLTRSKNSINVAMKNLTDFSVSLLLFWAFGFAVMFGASHSGWFGCGEFFPTLGPAPLKFSSFFLFQAMFCATAATIVSGAVAERMRFSSYVVVTMIVSGLVYPVFGHWAWGGRVADGTGWLASLGFVDFAGSTVVHGVGACSALAAILVIGPRTGRFETGTAARKISGSNLPLAMLGTLLLWLGWVGFNGGSTLAMNGQVAGVICNTLLAAAAGMISALCGGALLGKKADVHLVINGSLAGLVAITAGCHAVPTSAAVLIGAVGAIVMMTADSLLLRYRIDDAVGAIPVHGAAGLWGTMAVALFGNLDVLNTGLSRWEQLQAQAIGAGAAFVGVFGVTSLLFRLANAVVPFRVSEHDEQVGLNIAEHGSSTETLDLILEMEQQRRSGDFSQTISVEPGSELGPVAAQYNRVLEKVSEESRKAEAMTTSANEARRQAEFSNAELAQLVTELSEFNELAEGRELRMVALKHEVNGMLAAAGNSNKYVIDDPVEHEDLLEALLAVEQGVAS